MTKAPNHVFGGITGQAMVPQDISQIVLSQQKVNKVRKHSISKPKTLEDYVASKRGGEFLPVVNEKHKLLAKQSTLGLSSF